VLDSSAVLAVINREEGADIVQPLLGHATISAVNVAEVHTKLTGHGAIAPSYFMGQLE